MNFEEQAPGPIPVQVGGKEYRLTPLTYRDHCEAARRMRSSWKPIGEVIKSIGENLPDELQKALVEVAYTDERSGGQATMTDVFQWYTTPEGYLIRMWLLLRKHHRDEFSDANGGPNLDAVDVWLTLAGEDSEPDKNPGELDGLPSGNSPTPGEKSQAASPGAESSKT